MIESHFRDKSATRAAGGDRRVEYPRTIKMNAEACFVRAIADIVD